MKTKTTRILSIQDPQAISIAAKIIGQGGSVVFPTDTIYGLAADPWNGQAIQDIYTAKGRPQEKAIPVLIGSLPQLSLITQSLSDKMLTLATSFWPGPLTLVLPKKESLPEELSQYTTLGVRMPDNPFTLALLLQTGPLATTSANISGTSNPVNAQDVINQLNGRVDLILDGGSTPGDSASTVVDCTNDDLIILREGPISYVDLLKHWSEST